MDSEIRKILDEPESNTPRDHLELAVGAGGKVRIAGHEFPAPAAAVIAMLELIQSPFVDGDINREVNDMDVFRALYLLSERDKAVSPILRWMRREEALDRLKNQFDVEKYPHVALIVSEQLKGVADAQAEFDAAAMRFAESLGAFHIADAGRIHRSRRYTASGDVGDTVCHGQLLHGSGGTARRRQGNRAT